MLSEFEFAFESAFASPFAIHHGAGAKCAGSHCINLTFPFNLRYNTHAADLTSALHGQTFHAWSPDGWS
jgi:hypothetical protein